MKIQVLLLVACLACSAHALRWSSSAVDSSVAGSPVSPSSVNVHLVHTDDLDIPIRVTVTAARDVPLDFFLVQDLSGSFGDDLAVLRSLSGNIVTALTSEYSSVHFGVGSYIDKFDIYEYRTDLSLTSDSTAFINTVNGLTACCGGDFPESQFTALLCVGRRANTAEIGYRPDAFRVAFLTTDATAHQAGDAAHLGANNGDGVINSEDYPSVAQVGAGLQFGKITPIIAATSDVVGFYNGVVATWGFGSVTTLTTNSNNIIDSIRNGIATAVRDVFGSITSNPDGYAQSLTPLQHLGVAPGATVQFILKLHCGLAGAPCDNDSPVVVSFPGFGSTTVNVDVNQRPRFIAPFPAAVYNVFRTHSLSFTVTCADADPADILTITASGLPAGATFGSFAGANPKTGTFSYTPMVGGTHSVRFDCNDHGGLMADPLFVRIIVDHCPFELGVAKDYNVVATESFSASSGDVEGKLAVGGNTNINHYSVGHSLPAIRPQPSFDLVVAGVLNFPTGTVGVGPNDGEIVHGSALSVLPEENSYGDAFLNAGFLNWPAIRGQLAFVSGILNALPATGTWATEWGTMTLTGTNAVENLFSMNTADLEAAHTIIFDVPASSVAIIRVRGATATLQSKGMFLAGWVPADSRRTRNLFFYPDATDLTIQWISVQGSVLAPKANLNCPSGLIEGQVWVKRWLGQCQVNFKHMVTCAHYSTAPRTAAVPTENQQQPRGH